jgi:DNA-binding response OmpR family regulator
LPRWQNDASFPTDERTPCLSSRERAMSQPVPRAARRVLVVEDEVLIAMLIETILDEAGYVPVVANTLQEAADLIAAGPPDIAILDLNIQGRKVYPVAEQLQRIGVPFIFATGGGAGEIDFYPGSVSVRKPFQAQELIATIARLLG